jgi:hypothetical protein
MRASVDVGIDLSEDCGMTLLNDHWEELGSARHV